MHDITDAHMHIGWYNERTGQWDKAEPDLPAFMREASSDKGQTMADDTQPAYRVVAVREPGRGGEPIQIEPGDRVRLVIEGTVEDVEQGILGGGLPVIVTDAGRRVETNYPMLGAARIEVLAPVDDPEDDFPDFPARR